MFKYLFIYLIRILDILKPLTEGAFELKVIFTTKKSCFPLFAFPLFNVIQPGLSASSISSPIFRVCR